MPRGCGKWTGQFFCEKSGVRLVCRELMMADVSILEKNTNESVSENNSNNCLDKRKIYTEINCGD